MCPSEDGWKDKLSSPPTRQTNPQQSKGKATDACNNWKEPHMIFFLKEIVQSQRLQHCIIP